MNTPNSFSRRRVLMQWAALGAFGPAGLSALIQDALAKGDMPAAPGIYDLSGTATVNGMAAKTGTMVKPGDKVATGPKSHAVVVLGQDAYLLRAGTNVTFEADRSQSDLLSSVLITTGKVLSVFAKRSKKEVSIKAPNATIGIRGTGAYIEVHEGRSYFCLCYGTAEVGGAGLAENRSFTTKHHESPVWLDDRGGKLKIDPAPMLEHTDAELIMLEKLSGREPPFVASGLAGRY